jgi:hypothetical protein
MSVFWLRLKFQELVPQIFQLGVHMPSCSGVLHFQLVSKSFLSEKFSAACLLDNESGSLTFLFPVLQGWGRLSPPPYRLSIVLGI